MSLPSATASKDVLYIATKEVYPATDGGKQAAYHLVKHLAQQCTCYFAFFHTLPEEQLTEQIEHFKTLNVECFPIYLDRRDTIQSILISICRGKSIKFSKYHNHQILKKFISFITEKQIDIIVAEQSHLGWYTRQLKKRFPDKKIILREQNIEYDLVKQYAGFQHNLLKKMMVYGQYLLTKADEQSTWQTVDKTIFISDSDAKHANDTGKIPLQKSAMAYIGRIYSGKMIPTSGKGFLYSGGLKSIQNTEMIRHFIQHYWQPFMIANSSSSYTFDLTSNTEEDICHYLSLEPDEIKHLHIRPLGFVPDFQQAIATHTFFLSPTNFGSGIRVKVVEAMSQGALVMMSTLDYNSCKFFEHKKNVLLYTSFEEFVDNIHFIEEHPEEAAKIRKQAYLDAKLHFNWQNLINEILQ